MNGEQTRCRWCGAITMVLNCGRCSDCDSHYHSHAARANRPMIKRNFHHGNYIAFGFILMVALTSAETCFFDTNLGRLSCLQVQNTSTVVIPVYSYLRTNMTPFKAQQQYERFMAKQAKEAHPTSSITTGNSSSLPEPKLNNSTTVASTNRTAAIPACQNDREKDWQAYCWVMWSQGIYLDCWNPNAASKAEIMRNMAKIKGCVYVV